MTASNGTTGNTGRHLSYRRQAILLPALLGVSVFAGILVILQNPGFITKSPAFNPGGYLQNYSPQSYYQFVLTLLAFVGVTSLAAFVVGVRSSWYPYQVVRGRKIASALANWLAAIVVTALVGALFLLILPVDGIGAFFVLVTLSVSFALVGYFSRWASGLPDELLLAMEEAGPLEALESIDLDTSAVGHMTESVEDVSSLKPGSVAMASSQRFQIPGRVWRDVALAAIPSFFGLMGLAQLRQGRWSRGVAFLVEGLALGAVSSWYMILPSRIGEFLSGQKIQAVTSLAWTSSAPVVGILLAAFLFVWIIQLTDAVRYTGGGLGQTTDAAARTA